MSQVYPTQDPHSPFTTQTKTRSTDHMNKLELIQALKDATDLSKSEAAAVVDIFFNGMAEELAKGGRVEIRGLFSFHVKEYGS